MVFFWSRGDFGGVFCNRGENESERNDFDGNLPIYPSPPSTLVSLPSSSSLFFFFFFDMPNRFYY